MSKNSQSPEYQSNCQKLWEALKGTTVDRFSPQIRLHEKSTFLGYADVTVNIVTALGVVAPIKIRGIGVKVLNGKQHLEMPSERGADDKWYPIAFPKSGELRAVLTTRVFAEQAVTQAIAEAAEQVAKADAEVPAQVPADEAPAQEMGGISADNPFTS